MRTLSKSKLISYRQCPKKLWLEVHKTVEPVISASTEASFATGHAVGDVSRQVYDEAGRGVLIDYKSVGFDGAYEQTAQLLQGRKPIFEAAFNIPGAMCFADVLLPVTSKGQKVWRMVEVKASTSVKEYHRDDVAIQAHVARSAGVPLRSVALAHIDNQWVYPGNGDYSGLLVEEDLTDEAFSREAEVIQWMADAQKVVRKRQAPDIRTGKHCQDPHPCGFLEHCASKEPATEHPIAWLPGRLKADAKRKVDEDGVDDMSKLNIGHLNDLQKRVVYCHTRGMTMQDFEGATRMLSPLKYPAQFLDFETVQFAVPIWKGTRPYQQIPFQFSLHRLTKAGKSTHAEFLDLTGKDPSRKFAEALIGACGERGPIYVYNASFESSRIKELAQRFPRLAAPLTALLERMVDLHPIARDHFYCPSQQGSWSIKAVLPAMCPELSYDQLSGVKDGGMAMEAYKEAIHGSTTKADKEIIRDELLAYCRMDTFGLMAIYQTLTQTRAAK